MDEKLEDLISRSEAKKIANKFTFTFAEERERYMDFLDYCLKNAPTVDAKPVRGEWIRKNMQKSWGKSTDLICSICGEKSWLGYNFCPNCGADMRKQVENEKK